ncbi:hypothetical protein VM1G_11897 [Cytospora mali]|uniref:Uncharacterized protein n=1 Tax=Cytospora mali TaxID=578113 RepID=A0A194W9Z8_CYTMA|nr:hypothetical protein VM1G_11897 [Valsa mali]
MGYTKDADDGEFALPPPPASIGLRSEDDYGQFSTPDASRASTPSSGVQDRTYRHANLAVNNIHIRRQLPRCHIHSSYMETVRTKQDSNEDDVAVSLNDTIYPNPKRTRLMDLQWV